MKEPLEDELFALALEAANEITNEWQVGNSWYEDDGEDGQELFDQASDEEVARRILPFLKKAREIS